MPTIQINSPANGSSVAAGSSLLVNVTWDVGSPIVLPRKGKRRTITPAYTITCTDTMPFGTDSMNDTTTFTVPAGAGPSKSVMVVLLDNSTSPGTPLASASVTVNVQSATTVFGTITLPPPPPPPPPVSARAKDAKAAPTDMFVCGTFATGIANIICVTYQVVLDQTVPRDGVSSSPKFTISEKIKQVKQYSSLGGGLKMSGSTWQATVKASLTGITDAYQLQVWFLDSTWTVKGTVSAPLSSVAKTTACIP